MKAPARVRPAADLGGRAEARMGPHWPDIGDRSGHRIELDTTGATFYPRYVATLRLH